MVEEHEDVWLNQRPEVRSVVGQCPTCDQTHDLEVEQADNGSYLIPDSDRYVKCACGANVDFGAVIRVQFEHELSPHPPTEEHGPEAL